MIRKMRTQEELEGRAFQELKAITAAGLGHCEIGGTPSQSEQGGEIEGTKHKRNRKSKRRKRRKERKEGEKQKPRKTLTNQRMHAINGNATIAHEQDRIWCNDALGSITHAIEENDWQIEI